MRNRNRRRRVPRTGLLKLVALNALIAKLAAECVEELIEAGHGPWFPVVEQTLNKLAKSLSRSRQAIK